MALNASGHTVIIDIKVGRGTGQADQALQKVSRTTKQAGKNAANTRQQFANLAGAFTGLMAAKWVKQGFTALTKPAIDFETAMVRIQTLTNAGAVDMAKFEKRISAVAAVSPFAPVELADALVDLNRVAGSADDAMKLLGTTTGLSMAGMGKLGLAKATKMTSEVMRSFGMNTDEAHDAVERLVAMSQRGRVGVEDFSNVMGRLSTAAVQGRQSFDEVVKAFLLIRRSGMQPTRIVRTLSSAMGELIGGKAKGVLEGAGITLVDDMGKLLPFSKIMLQMAEQYKRDTEGTVELIVNAFGRTARRPLLAYLKQVNGAFEGMKGQEVFDALGGSVKKSGGILERFATKWLGTTSAQLEIMMDKLQLAAMAIGKFLLPGLQAAADAIGGIANAFTEFSKTWYGGIIVKFGSRFLAASVFIWAARAAMAGFVGIVRVVTANIGAGFIGRLFGVSTAMGGVAKASRLATWAVRGFWGAATLGLAFLPQVLGAIKKVIAGEGDYEKSLKKRGMDKQQAAAQWLMQNPEGSWWYRMFATGTVYGVPLISSAYKFGDALKESGGVFANFMETAVKSANKLKDLAQQTSKSLYEGIRLAGNEMQNFLKIAKGESKYEPAEAKGKYFHAVRKRLRSAGGKVSGADAPMVNAALEGMAFAEPLIRKASMGIISPSEHKQLMQALLSVGVVGTDLSRMYGPQIMGRKLMKSFNEKFTGEIVKMGTPEAMAYQARLVQMRGFKSPTTGDQLPGTSPSAGYRGVGKDFPWHQNAYAPPTPKVQQGPVAPWQNFGKSESGIVAGEMEESRPQQSVNVFRMDKLVSEMKQSRVAMVGILNRLDRPLKTESQSRDPLGGGQD